MVTQRSPYFTLLCLAALALAPTPTARAAPLLAGFGGPAGYGSNILPANDDGSTMALDLTPAFPEGLRFFGGPYDQFWVNNNGNITFSGAVRSYTPMPFPIAARPMIAPYWGDVDTRGGSPGAGQNLVYWHMEPGRLIVTWHMVGYYGSHTDLLNDFQLIITNTLSCGSGDFDVEFRYNQCQWTTGDASGGTGGLGGTPAQAGFDAGNEMDFVALPGSFTEEILNLCTTSNIGVSGVWQFAVRSGGVVCPDAGMPCEVPDQIGPCAIGRTQCVGGSIECQPIVGSTPERCDGIDNDCNGAADDAEMLCDGVEICSRGECVPPCFEGGCTEGLTCDDSGLCVESACVGVDCPVGQRCEGGSCREACEGIVCPHGQQCLSGRCTDPCAAAMCDEGQVCRDGICIAACPCLPCPSGETCGADGQCRAPGCDIVICDEGSYCDDGRCYDACEGVVCPNRQVCISGECVEPSEVPDAGLMVDAGMMVMEDAGPPVVEPDAGFDAGPPIPVDAGRLPPMDGGCGCRVTPRAAPAWAWAIVGGFALVSVRRRRR